MLYVPAVPVLRMTSERVVLFRSYIATSDSLPAIFVATEQFECRRQTAAQTTRRIQLRPEHTSQSVSK